MFHSIIARIVKMKNQDLARLLTKHGLQKSDIQIRKRLLTGTVPVNNFLLTGTVRVNNSLLTGTLSNVRRCWLAMPLGAGVLHIYTLK